jgi:hypothetical protein
VPDLVLAELPVDVSVVNPVLEGGGLLEADGLPVLVLEGFMVAETIGLALVVLEPFIE